MDPDVVKRAKCADVKCSTWKQPEFKSGQPNNWHILQGIAQQVDASIQCRIAPTQRTNCSTAGKNVRLLLCLLARHA